MKKLIVVISILMFASVAHGAGMPTGFYVGASYLKADIDETDEDAAIPYEIDDSGNGFRLNLGWQFHPHIATELSYLYVSDIDGEGYLYGYNEYFDFDLETKATAQISILANTPLMLDERVGAYAKVGVGWLDYDVKVGDVSAGDDDVTVTYGAGVFWRFADQWTARLEFDRWDDIEDLAIDVYSLGIQYHF